MSAGAQADGADPQIHITRLPNGATSVELKLEDGLAVSWLRVYPYAIRVGTATVRMDGIGDVGTLEEHRNRGYSRRVLEAAVRSMVRGDGALSMLYGIPDYYPKFGFTTAGPDYLLHLTNLESSATLPEGWTVRPYRPEDLPQLQRLYNQNTRHAVGAAVRSGESSEWTGAPWTRLEPDQKEGQATGAPAAGEECRVVLNPQGQVSGYVWRGSSFWYVRLLERRDPQAAVFAEVMAAHPVAAGATLAAGCAWALEQGAARGRPVERVTLGWPPEGLVSEAAARGWARFEQRCSPAGDSMARVLDGERLLTSLVPELTTRLRQSGLRVQGHLTIGTEIGAATLVITPEGVQARSGEPAGQAGHAGDTGAPGEPLVLDLPQWDLARLALGAFPPGSVLDRLPSPPTAAVRDIAEALFPLRHQHMHYPDRY